MKDSKALRTAHLSFAFNIQKVRLEGLRKAPRLEDGPCENTNLLPAGTVLDAANANSTAQPGQKAVQQLRSGRPLGQRPTGLRAVETTASELSDNMGHTQGQLLLCASTGSRLSRSVLMHVYLCMGTTM